MDRQQGPTYSTGNDSQNPVINHKEKEYETAYIYMFICIYVHTIYKTESLLLYTRN